MSAWPQFNSIQWLASFLLLVLLIYCFKQKSQRIALPLGIFLALTLTWSLCAALLPFALTLEDKIFLNRIKMVGASLVSLSICWLSVAIHGQLRIPRWVWFVASAVNVISVVIVVSPFHYLLIKDYSIRKFVDGELLTYANGVWFPIHSLMARLLLLAAFFFLWQGMKTLHPFHKTRNKLIMISILVPSILDTLAVYFYPELRFLQVVPTALAFSSVVLVYAVFGHRALEVIPFARAKIIEHMTDPCTMWDERGHLMDYNPAAAHALQLNSQHIGNHVQALTHLPLELHSHYPWSTNFEFETNSNCYLVENRAILNQQGTNIGSTLLFKDVSGQKRLERELRSLNQVKTTFMGILAHDLSGNIANIAHASEILMRDHDQMPPADRTAMLQSIHNGTQDVNDFIMQLSEWARTQFHSLKVERTSLNVRGTVMKVADYLRPLMIEKSLSLQCNVFESAWASADPRMIETVVRNLLANAIKFSPAETEIQINVTDTGHTLKFSVIDQGKGLEVERLNEFFKDTTAQISTASFGSQGLGLLLCRSFIRLHQSTIWAEKMNDGSSAIHFHLDKEKAV